MISFKEFQKPLYIEEAPMNNFKFSIEGEVEIDGKLMIMNVYSQTNWEDFDSILTEETSLAIKDDLAISWADLGYEEQESLLKVLKRQLKNHMKH